MATLTLLIAPSPPRDRVDRNYPGRFDARLAGDRPIIERSRTPFLDAARALLASGLALPDDMLEMRHDNSEHVVLRAKVSVAAKLTVSDAKGPPRFVPWHSHPNTSPMDSVSLPMRQTEVPATPVAAE
jgi:hypothetical protein